MNANHVNGLSIVSIGTGERIGRVSEILFDAAADRVTAFAVDTGGGGMLSGKAPRTNWIAARDVSSIGPDAMTVQDTTVLSESAADGEMTPLTVLVGQKVVTEGGTFVGQVTSAEIDEKSMAVTGLEVSPGFFKSNRVVSKSDLITMGEEMVIVSDSVCADTSTEATSESADSHPVVESRVYEAPRSDTREQ